MTSNSRGLPEACEGILPLMIGVSIHQHTFLDPEHKTQQPCNCMVMKLSAHLYDPSYPHHTSGRACWIVNETARSRTEQKLKEAELQ